MAHQAHTVHDGSVATLDDEGRAQVERERVAILYRRTPVALVTVVGVSGLLAWLLSVQVPVRMLAGWLGTLWMVTAARTGLWLAFRRAPERRTPRAWERIFALGAAVSGLVWGLGGVAFTGFDLVAMVAVVFALGGMVAGASASNSTSMLSLRLFVVGSLGPTIAALLWQGVNLSVVVAVMLALFGLAMTALGREGGQAIVDSLRLEQRNAVLVDRLRAQSKDLEASLLQSSVLASLGTMAAGVAHEVNNPLGYVLGNLEVLREDLAARPAARAVGMSEVVDECIQGVLRIRRIVEDLTATPRSAAHAEHRGDADVESILDSCLRVADKEIRDRATVVRQRQSLPRVQIDPIRLNQVFLNLLINAAQAIGEGGEGDQSGQRIEVRTGFEAERGVVVVEIADTGCGISAQALPHIFEPFYTTKAPGKGTGLGLSICHALVSSSGGSLSATSTPGHGTTMRVELVACPAEADAPAKTDGSAVQPPAGIRSGPMPNVVADSSRSPAEPAEPAAGQTPRRVLLVDDEPLVRHCVVRLLREHHVVTAGNGREALDALDQGSFDMIFCDLMMEGMTGMELHEQLMLRSPADAARMVFVTGGAFTPAARQFLQRIPNRTLAKPVQMAQLRALLDEPLVVSGPGPATPPTMAPTMARDVGRTPASRPGGDRPRVAVGE
ncbi:MAG: ATP-binding protein [Myxococcota bacterium]